MDEHDGPRIEASLRDDGNGQVSIDGILHPVATGSVDEAREEVMRLIREAAARTGRAVDAVIRDDDREWPIVVEPDGSVRAGSGNGAPGRRERIRPFPRASEPPAAPEETLRPGELEEGELEETVLRDEVAAPRIGPIPPAAPASVTPEPTPAPEPTAPADPPPSQTPTGETPVAPAWNADAAHPSRRELRQSFLTQEQSEEPATRGMRGALTRVGIRMRPSEEERSERADAQAVSQHWPGPRTIAVVNGKGGAGKTPTTVLLSAVFARYGGAGVLAWDNNQTRGTLGWRTEQGPHDATLLDLLPEVPRLLGTGAQSADLAHYVHHQTRDRFDVLRSKPMVLAHEQRIEPDDVDAIRSVAAKYYRLIVIDSGNDESDPMWLRMIDSTDQLVVATTTRDDHAEAGALLLEALAERDERSARLATQSVVVVTQADSTASAKDVAHVADGYRAIAREMVTIPFDPELVDGILRFGSLRAATQRAWLAAAAAVARGL